MIRLLRWITGNPGKTKTPPGIQRAGEQISYAFTGILPPPIDPSKPTTVQDNTSTWKHMDRPK